MKPRMPERDARLWETVLRRGGINRHPSKLSKMNRSIQYMVLHRISDKPELLPNRPLWEKWFMWHYRKLVDK